MISVIDQKHKQQKLELSAAGVNVSYMPRSQSCMICKAAFFESDLNKHVNENVFHNMFRQQSNKLYDMIDDELRILDTKTKVKNTDSNFNENSMVLPVYDKPASDT